jgi:hypothetical protein
MSKPTLTCGKCADGWICDGPEHQRRGNGIAKLPRLMIEEAD